MGGFGMGIFDIWHLLFFIIWVVVIGIPVAHILSRVGLSIWWTILAFIPLVNVIALWVFAYAQWPERA